jgi:hypothetical protein
MFSFFLVASILLIASGFIYCGNTVLIFVLFMQPLSLDSLELISFAKNKISVVLSSYGSRPTLIFSLTCLIS